MFACVLQPEELMSVVLEAILDRTVHTSFVETLRDLPNLRSLARFPGKVQVFDVDIRNAVVVKLPIIHLARCR